MTNRPINLTEAEIEEIASIKKFQRSCGTTRASEMVRILKKKTTFKFKTRNGAASPMGDLILVQTNLGQRRSRSRLFYRMKSGSLVLLN